jgi:hypothetical protein
MIWSDPIVDEVRRIRDAHSARFNYDLLAIFLHIKEEEKKRKQKFIAYSSERLESQEALRLPEPDHTVIENQSSH